MAVAINGSGTVTGISVGGLPDGIVDADMIAADAVTAAKIGSKTFTSYAIIADVKASNANGGTFTSGDWRTRDLNTEISDEDGMVSISSNQFTLAAGSYLIIFTAPAMRVGGNQTRLYNATTSAEVQRGQLAFSSTNSVSSADKSTGYARVVISGSTVFEIQHRGFDTEATFGFGAGTAGGVDWSASGTNGCIYTTVEIYKEA